MVRDYRKQQKKSTISIHYRYVKFIIESIKNKDRYRQRKIGTWIISTR